MSILNARVWQDRALVAVDTEATTGDVYVAGPSNKMIPLPAQQAILAGRGLAGLVGSVGGSALLSPLDFDGLVADLPGIMSRVLSGLRSTIPPAHWGDLEIVLIGYSAKERRIVGHQWIKHAESDAFVHDRAEPWYVAPWHSTLEGAPEPENVESIVQLARAQRSLLKSVAPAPAAAGGYLIIAEITGAGLRIWRECELSDGAAQLAPKRS